MTGGDTVGDDITNKIIDAMADVVSPTRVVMSIYGVAAHKKSPSVSFGLKSCHYAANRT